MLKTLQNAFKIKEIREKLLYTFFMLVVIRLGSQLPIPGVKTTFFAELFARQSSDAFGFFNTITGGSFTNMSVFALEHHAIYHIFHYHAAFNDRDSKNWKRCSVKARMEERKLQNTHVI